MLKTFPFVKTDGSLIDIKLPSVFSMRIIEVALNRLISFANAAEDVIDWCFYDVVVPSEVKCAIEIYPEEKAHIPLLAIKNTAIQNINIICANLQGTSGDQLKYEDCLFSAIQFKRVFFSQYLVQTISEAAAEASSTSVSDKVKEALGIAEKPYEEPKTALQVWGATLGGMIHVCKTYRGAHEALHELSYPEILAIIGHHNEMQHRSSGKSEDKNNIKKAEEAILYRPNKDERARMKAEMMGQTKQRNQR